MRDRSSSDEKGSLVSVIAGKCAILYVTSATACECVSQREVLQDKIKYCSSDTSGSQPFENLRLNSLTTAFF